MEDFFYNHFAGEDFLVLKDMVCGLYAEDPEGLPITEEKIAATVNECLCFPEKVQIIMIRCGDSIIGYGLLLFSWSNEYGGEVVHIDELYVKQGWRGRGVGARFIDYVLEEYKGAALFEVEVTPSNERALRFYAGKGFKVSVNTHFVLAR